jgi:Fe-S cluster assembly ATPase SufC
VDAMDFLTLVKDKIKLLEMDEKFLYRAVNEGFSGGEKKRNEILQMAILEPALCILDETDSGLDIDALKIVSQGVNSLRLTSVAGICENNILKSYNARKVANPQWSLFLVPPH